MCTHAYVCMYVSVYRYVCIRVYHASSSQLSPGTNYHSLAPGSTAIMPALMYAFTIQHMLFAHAKNIPMRSTSGTWQTQVKQYVIPQEVLHKLAEFSHNFVTCP